MYTSREGLTMYMCEGWRQEVTQRGNVYIFVHTYISRRVHIIHVRIHIYLYVYTCTHTFISMRVHMICVHIHILDQFLDVCVGGQALGDDAHVFVHINMYIYVCIHTYKYVCMCMYSYI